MPTIEKVSIALPTELLALVKQAVDQGDYASTSEVVREALREWKARRAVTVAAVAPQSVPSTLAADGLALLRVRGRALAALCRKFQVRTLSLFGSVLREDFHPTRSDLDVAVEFGAPKGMSLDRQYVDFKSALEALMGRPVDVVELAAMPDSRLKRTIERSRVTVYEQTT